MKLQLLGQGKMNTDQIGTFDLLTWLHLHDAQGVDWVVGVVLFVAALIGALLTMYTTAPSDLPSLGGADEVRDLAGDLKFLERMQKDSLSDPKGASDPNLADRLAYLRHLASRHASARRGLWLRGVPIFLAVGPLIASALATSFWQALLIGATGPALWKAIDGRRQMGSIAERTKPALANVTEDFERDRSELRSELRNLSSRHADLQSQLARTNKLLDAAYVALGRLRRTAT